jgi:exopolysaccharide biosynthesis polyprenyl glycosylphosphotransferase
MRRSVNEGVVVPLRPRRRIAPLRRGSTRKVLLALADSAGVGCAALALGALLEPRAGILAALMLPVCVLVAKINDLYDADEAKAWHLTSDEVPRLIYWATVSCALIFLVLSMAHVSELDASAAVVAWSVLLGVSASCRSLVRWLWRQVVPSERGLIVGVGINADAVVRKLELEPGHHLLIAGQVALSSETSGDDQVAPLRNMIMATAAHRVIVATDDLIEAELADVMSVCREEGVKLSIAPPTRSFLSSSARVHRVAEVVLVELSLGKMTPFQGVVKRTTDVLVSSVVLLLTLPVFAVLFVFVRLDSPGGALFRQTRAGLGGKPFTIIKFRSMCVEAEALLTGLVDIDGLEDPMFKLKDDPRVTRIGRYLRKTSLDELPQMWNVLRGEMSLVGPRPEEMRLVDRYDEPTRVVRLMVRPGLTGPMQVHGRGELTFAERIAIERDYVEHYSFARDVKILMRTLWVVLCRPGAF